VNKKITINKEENYRAAGATFTTTNKTRVFDTIEKVSLCAFKAKECV